jgi:hypothetical protein
MRVSVWVLGLAAILVLPPSLAAQNCRITAVDPDSAKVGDTVSASGESLGAGNVEQLFLTDGTTDIKVEILEQTDKLIKFKVPSGIKSGRYALMVQTKPPEPKLLEQPVKLTVEVPQT